MPTVSYRAGMNEPACTPTSWIPRRRACSANIRVVGYSGLYTTACVGSVSSSSAGMASATCMALRRSDRYSAQAASDEVTSGSLWCSIDR